MDTASLVQGLRFVDSFFPSGGFAFSSGLEAAVQGGAVRNADDLFRYVEDLLRNGIGRRDAVAVAKAGDALRANKLTAILEIDHELSAMKIGRESRLASRQVGKQIIRIAAEQIEGHPVLSTYLAAVETDRTPGHAAVALGLTLAAVGWKKDDAVGAFLYQAATGFIAAAVKLLPIGQREGQRLLHEWTPLIVEISAAACREASMASWSPVQDIYAMKHRWLESRLFRS
ncbi:MAG: urease accessory protein UreF [Nitrospira sp.]